MLRGRNIILGITGSIAAYKTVILVRLLMKEGVNLQIVMTPKARDFVTPLTLSTLSKKPVLTQTFDPVDGSWNNHVDLGNWADLMIIAPVSANTLAKMANGIADNLLLTVYLAAKCPIYFAPAMDLDMYKHVSTQNNVKTLELHGNTLISPREGELASGLCGAGRMEEPEIILEIIKENFNKDQPLIGKRAVVTAGPTYEAIDPVRFIGNHSSGLMGISIAEELANRGAEVKLVCGPTHLNVEHPMITRIDVTSSDEMYNVCTDFFDIADIVVMSAAVADFKPEKTADVKIKKEHKLTSIKLIPTKDILTELGKKKRVGQILVGFALESDNELSNARKKLHNKNLDFIVLNSLKDQGAGFGTKTNKITIIEIEDKISNFELKPKSEVASDIVNKIIELVK